MLQLEKLVVAVCHPEAKLKAMSVNVPTLALLSYLECPSSSILATSSVPIARHVWSGHHGGEVIGFVVTSTGWQAWPVCSA